MKPLYSLLHFAGGTFPTGAFSQSWGLETYIYYEDITDEKQFKDWLEMYIDKILGGLEGPIFCEAYDLVKSGKIDGLVKLEEQFFAMRLTKETRDVVARTGKAFMRIVSEICDDEVISRYYREQKEAGISFPIAFALVCARQEVGREEALESFIFSTVNGLVQSGLKLIPLGNAQAQGLLLQLYEAIEVAAKKAESIKAEDAFAFSPGLDIASMKHETLPTRLYMT